MGDGLVGKEEIPLQFAGIASPVLVSCKVARFVQTQWGDEGRIPKGRDK